MFLKIRHQNNKTYLSLVESYRDGSTSRHRTVVSLGELGQYNESSLYSIANKLLSLRGLSSSNVADFRKSEILKTYNWGATAVIRKLWSKLDLDYVLNEAFEGSRVKFNANETIFNIVLNRLTHPASKLKLYSHQDDIAGIQKPDLNHYYRALDVLAKNKEAVEELMFKNSSKPFSKEVDVVLYDVSTLYFESVSSDELRKKGWGKDGKSSEVQVVVGLSVDKTGRPLSFDVFPGNTYEGHTLISVLEKFKSRFSIDKVVIVADRGINNRDNLAKIRESGFDYVFGHRFKNAEGELKRSILDLESYTVISKDSEGNAQLAVKEIFLDKKEPESGKRDRLICSWSLARAVKDAKEREKNIEKAKYLIANPHKLEDKRGCKKYIKAIELAEEGNGSKKAVELNVEQITKDSTYDGFYTIQTSDTSLTAAEVLTAYKHLWKIEESFRVLKSSLETRPIYHWTPHRVAGHLVCCFIALTVERALESILTKKGVDHSVDRIREAINKMSVSKVKLTDEEPEIYLHQSLNSDEYKLSRDILKALGINIPRSYMTKEQFEAAYEKLTM